MILSTELKAMPKVAKQPEFLAKGEYGCVFSAPISCGTTKSPKKQSVRDVGKVFYDEEDFETEKVLMDSVARMDPNGDFTVRTKGACDISTTNIPTSEAVKCHVAMTKKDMLYKQLIMQKGGKSLYSFAQEHYGDVGAFIKMFKSMTPVFNGLVKLYENQEVHMDIKPDNMLYDGKKCILIDFGMMTKKAEIYHVDNVNVLQHTYPFYPVEMKAWHFMNKKRTKDISLKHLCDDFLDNLRVCYDLIIVKILKKHFGIDYFQRLISLHSYFISINQPLGLTAFDDMFPSKLDIYSVGMSLVQMMYLMNIYNTSDVNLQDPKGKKASKSQLLKMNTIKLFICQMIDMNAVTRIHPKDAFAMYTDLIKSM